MVYRKGDSHDYMMHEEDSSIYAKDNLFLGHTGTPKELTDNLKWRNRCEKCGKIKFMYNNDKICEDCRNIIEEK